MKKLEKLEKYVRVPDVNFFGAYFYDGEDIELHNSMEEFDDENGHVRLTIVDTIENGIFKKYKLIEDLKEHATEEVKKEYPLKKGDMLIYVQYEGFGKTHTKLVSLDDAINTLKQLDSKYFDEAGNLL